VRGRGRLVRRSLDEADHHGPLSTSHTIYPLSKEKQWSCLSIILVRNFRAEVTGNFTIFFESQVPRIAGMKNPDAAGAVARCSDCQRSETSGKESARSTRAENSGRDIRGISAVPSMLDGRY
jgi:hypothetical protein